MKNDEVKVNIYTLTMSKRDIVSRGYAYIKSFDLNELWHMCNWVCYSNSKPANLFSDIQSANSDIIFHDVNSEKYYLSLSFGWKSFNTLEEIKNWINNNKMFGSLSYEEAHVKLWNMLSEDSDLDKCEAFEIMQDEELLKGYDKKDVKAPPFCCFACGHVGRTGYDEDCECIDKCSLCPISNNANDGDNCLDGLFADWCDEKDLDKRSKIAQRISELPWVYKKGGK